jgi:hypothetical protein
VRLYIKQGEGSQDKTSRMGQAVQERKNMTGSTGKEEYDRQYRKGRW